MKIKRILRCGLALALALAFTSLPIHEAQLQAAPTVHFETRQTTQLSRDTYLHQISKITSAGLLDVSVLEIPLDDPYLDVGVFNSAVELGLRQATTRILSDHKAFAGVNGDFFGLAGTHSVPLGFEAVDGHLSISDGVNREANTSASLILSNAGAFIEYVRPTVVLRLDGQQLFPVGMVNMVTNLAWPSFLTHGYVTSTAEIDSRLGRSYKLVVQNNVITAITFYTVNVPENGFVVIMNPDWFHRNSQYFRVGQPAEMRVSANIDLDAVDMAISGSHRILHNGEIPHDLDGRGGGRAPRTLLGLNAAGDRLFLMVIDGRSHSVGATLVESAHFMRQFGVHNAINLDGGGSSTMAAQMPGAEALRVVNVPSDGSQRGVINTIGVVNNSDMGEIVSLGVNTTQNNLPVGVFSSLAFFGHDEYLNQVPLGFDRLEIAVSNADSVDGGIIPRAAGPVIVYASLGDTYVWQSFNAVHVTEIIPSARRISGETTLTFTGMDNFGNSVRFNAALLSYEIYPPGLGTIENGRFVPTGEGNGWLRVSTPTNDAWTYIPIGIHTQANPINTFANDSSVRFSGWPGHVIGSVSADGQATLTYDFAEGESPQLAYLHLNDAQRVYANSYRIGVYGNNSNHWLRGIVYDADGNTFVVEFARNIDFNGWRNLTAQVPDGAVQPVRLMRISATSLAETEDSTYALRFGDLVYFGSEPVATPQNSVARDPLRVWSFGDRAEHQRDITFMGPVGFAGEDVPENWEQGRSAALAAFSDGASAGFYGGRTDLSEYVHMPVMSFGGYLSPQTFYGLYVLRLNAANGGIAAADAGQWGRLQGQLANATSNNIVIQMNNTPQSFRHSQEAAMLHDLLAKKAADGFNVFVVSNGGGWANIQLRDGVRYITLPVLQRDGDVNPNFAMLRFRMSNGDLHYALEWVN